MEYLVFLRRPFGFLGNGHELWYVDNSEIFSEKRYLAVNFDKLLASRNVGALRIFMGLFAYSAHFAPAGQKAPATRIADGNLIRRQQSEDELRDVIYGLDNRDSFFEKCGTFLFKNLQIQDHSVLPELYKNCLYFTFRLIFIAFFEDRHRDILEKHTGYRDISLLALFQQVKALAAEGKPDSYEAWDELQRLFRTLDQGNVNRDIPVFDGGLFAAYLAEMLDRPKMMTNAELLELLDMLYGESATGQIRDFSSLSVIQLGHIYESLLEFEFRIAEENLWYFTCRERKNGRVETIDGYYDTEDYKNIEKAKKYEIIGSVREYKKGQPYLVGGKNSRKQSASYYTPQSLSRPLVKAALDDAVSKLDEHESILDIRILDNACGSGHMLVEALQYLTQLAIDRLEKDGKLKAVLADEKRRVNDILTGLGLLQTGLEIDELAILKRILLKRTIYGVDAQPFAVELTKLSLWIETFIFGTPLSFIEHHIKTGNSLIGCKIARVRKMLGEMPGGQTSLLDEDITASLRALAEVFLKLGQLQDTTAADITASKNIYETEIKPKLDQLDIYFNLLNAADLLLAESAADRKLAADPPPAGAGPGKAWQERLLKQACAKQEYGCALLTNYAQIAQNFHNQTGEWQKHEELLAKMRANYGFFNWQLEFPEAFASASGKGFHVIIGNPPWDKTKFSDPDFFPAWRSNYRLLSNSERKRIATELLAKPYIRERYEKQASAILAHNEYYKDHFPYSRGEGDGNLFRFFVENNLGLLRKRGALNYVIPTALWTEEGSTTLRKHILDNFWLRSFHGFENRENLFPDIDSRYKFGLMQIEKPAAPMPASEKNARARFMLTDPEELAAKNKDFDYTIDDINATSPYWRALMEMRSRSELNIMRKIHECGYDYLKPDWIDFRNELHATNDKKIFRERHAAGMLPLYKGACIWQFDSEYWLRAGNDNKNEYWLEPAEFDAYLAAKERGRLVQEIYPQLQAPGRRAQRKAVLEALGLKTFAELDQFIVQDRLFPRLAFRAIASDTNERTMIAAVIPAGVGTQNSLWTSIPKRYVLAGKFVKTVEQDPLTLFFAQAFFNSLVFDWVMRCSIAINVNKTYILRMPMPQPAAAKIAANADFMKLAKNSLRLSAFYNNAAFAPFFSQFGLDSGDMITEKKIADMARRENDAIIARLYGLTRSDMEVLLATFAVMNANQPGYGSALLDLL